MKKKEKKEKKDKNLKKRKKIKKTLKELGSKVDKLRFKLKAKNELIRGKRKKLAELEKDRQGVAPGPKRRVLNVSIHKLRNSLKKMAKNADGLRKIIHSKQVRMVQGQSRGAKSQYDREVKRKQEVLSDYEKVRGLIRLSKSEIDRLERIEQVLKANVKKLELDELKAAESKKSLYQEQNQ